MMPRARASGLAVAAVGVVAMAVAAWLFPRALLIVALEQRLTRDAALAIADSFLAAHDMAPPEARTAVRFERNDSLQLFVELGGGGADSLNALVRGSDVALYRWSVRAFVPGDAREARVDLAPDGRVIGFERKLAEADPRPDIGADSARRVAEHTLDRWLPARAGTWTLVSSSYDTKPASGRVDRTFTFERTDRRIADAPIRINATIAGDLPSSALQYVDVPESFERRYAEMRSWNDFLAIVASMGAFVMIVAGIIVLARYGRAWSVRWRPALVVGGVIGALMLGAGFNEVPGSWFFYDTAMSATTFRALQLLLAVAAGASTMLLAAVTLAAAELLTRRAFPRHLDWWKLWKYRGTREVAASVGGGYAVAAIAFAYVALFYLVTRTLFGWWVPSEILDDPNQIASPIPWISGIAMSLNAAVWEEALFRALPLSLLSIWVGQRAGRRWWMAAGVIVTALIFGFAHANYPSWPPYSRGVEIFLDACFWAVLFLMFGLLLTVVAHFVYDAVLFGLFAAQGSAPEYRVTSAIILAVIVAPAVIVLWRRVRQGMWPAAPDDARFDAWVPGAVEEAPPVATGRTTGTISSRALRLAGAAAVLGVLVALGRPTLEPLGPRFTVDREAIFQRADSALRARGGDPSAWKRLYIIGRDTLPAWRRFLARHDLEREAQTLTVHHPPAWWIVRYVHTDGTPADRAEEWRIRLWPDGRLLDVRRVIPDSAQRDTASAADLRRIAMAALTRAGVDTVVLRETDVSETARPARKDVTVTYTDTSVALPAGAAARAWVEIAGDEPLTARRGIELPEDFLRADRARATNQIVITASVALLGIALLVAAALWVKRRRPIVIDDGQVGTRGHIALIAGLAILAMAAQANGIPQLLYGYDTAQPWGTFVGVTAMGFVASLLAVLGFFGIWRGVEGLRRRVGIPWMTGSDDVSGATREMLLAGLGMGGAAFAAGQLSAMVSAPAIPPAASTILDEVVPWLSGVAGVPVSAFTSAVFVALPVLTLAALTRRWPLRLLIAAAVVVAGVALAWATADSGPSPARMIAGVVALAVVGVAVVTWGTRHAWSWFVAALFYEGLQGLRGVVHSTVWQGRVAGALELLVVAALLVVVARRARPTHPAASSNAL